MTKDTLNREIVDILLLDDETIRRYIRDYFLQHKLSPENEGNESPLNDDQTEQLMAHLQGKTYLYVKAICAYVKSTFKMHYSIGGMTKWLHAHGFCYKKPHGVPAKADKVEQDAFINYYESLKQGLKQDDMIYFVDSTHPQHQTQLTYAWIEKGIRKFEKMTACQKRVNVIGGINLEGRRIEYRQVDWDNAGYHKSQKLRGTLNNTSIKLHDLPPYSPNLNPIERLWKLMHERATYNRYYAKFADFTEGILNFFRHINKRKSLLANRITDNFQTLHFAS